MAALMPGYPEMVASKMAAIMPGYPEMVASKMAALMPGYLKMVTSKMAASSTEISQSAASRKGGLINRGCRDSFPNIKGVGLWFHIRSFLDGIDRVYVKGSGLSGRDLCVHG
jgi:hypothetical protein